MVVLAAGPLGTAVPRLLGSLDPVLGANADLAAIVADQTGMFAGWTGTSRPVRTL